MAKAETEKNNKNLIVIAIAGIAVVAIVVIAVILAMSGVFGKKTVTLIRGVNQVDPGSYVCVNDAAKTYAYLIASKSGTDDDDDYTKVTIGANSTAAIVVEKNQRVGVEKYGDETVNIVCTRQ